MIEWLIPTKVPSFQGSMPGDAQIVSIVPAYEVLRGSLICTSLAV